MQPFRNLVEKKFCQAVKRAIKRSTVSSRTYQNDGENMAPDRFDLRTAEDKEQGVLA